MSRGLVVAAKKAGEQMPGSFSLSSEKQQCHPPGLGKVMSFLDLKGD